MPSVYLVTIHSLLHLANMQKDQVNPLHYPLTGGRRREPPEMSVCTWKNGHKFERRETDEAGGSPHQNEDRTTCLFKSFNTVQHITHLRLLQLTQTTDVAADCDGGGGAVIERKEKRKKD